MTPQVDPIRLTIVDIMGVILPGMVWTVLLLTIRHVIVFGPLGSQTPLGVAHCIAQGFSPEAPAREIGGSFYTSFLVVSLLLGYLSMALSSKCAEHISRPLGMFGKQTSNHFPYVQHYRSLKCFALLDAFIRSELGRTDWQELPGYQPFECCKRILKMNAPVLWEDAQRREAQVRMLASLLLAAVTSIAGPIFALLQSVPYSELWLFWSVVASFVIAYAFRVRRWREVADVYLSTLIVASKQQQRKE